MPSYIKKPVSIIERLRNPYVNPKLKSIMESIFLGELATQAKKMARKRFSFMYPGHYSDLIEDFVGEYGDEMYRLGANSFDAGLIFNNALSGIIRDLNRPFSPSFYQLRERLGIGGPRISGAHSILPSDKIQREILRGVSKKDLRKAIESVAYPRQDFIGISKKTQLYKNIEKALGEKFQAKHPEIVRKIEQSVSQGVQDAIARLKNELDKRTEIDKVYEMFSSLYI